MKFRALLIGTGCALLLASPACAQLAISGLSVASGEGSAEEVHLAISGSMAPRKLFTLANPERVVVDLPVTSASNLSLPTGNPDPLVRGVRFGRFDKDTSRLVLDVTVPVKATVTSTTENELVITLTPMGPVPAAAPVAAEAESPSAHSPFVVLGTARGSAPAPATPVIPENKKPVVVIDAGHGGQDPGTIGADGTQEKDITLAFAGALKEGLLRTGRYRVVMTREDDRFIMLGERVAIARRMKGDIFISLHVNSNPTSSTRGLSIYTLSENASDDQAAALAERENKADVLPGLNLNTTDADVASILIDLAQRQTMNKSAKFADTVVADLQPKVDPLTPSPHRFAGFRVLKAPDIPSVLIELGFITNARDDALLHSHEYENLVVASIIKALDDYRARQKL